MLRAWSGLFDDIAADDLRRREALPCQ